MTKSYKRGTIKKYPCDFFVLFPKLKLTLKERRFQTIDDVKQNTETVFKDISLSVYQECFQKWKRRWQRYIVSQGDYLEGDYVYLE